MSNGPISTGETCIDVIKKGRMNIKIIKKEWCGYKGECENEMILDGDKICWHCIYMKKFDIPQIIRITRKEKNDNTK